MDIVTDGPDAGPAAATSTCAARGRSAPPSTSASTATTQDVVVDLTDVETHRPHRRSRCWPYATREAGRAGHHLTLRGCGPAVRRMLHLSRLIRVVEVERAPRPPERLQRRVGYPTRPRR